MLKKTPVFIGDYHKYDILSQDGIDYILCEEPDRDGLCESIPIEGGKMLHANGRVQTRLVEIILSTN